jgi:sugar lactone lactonase YvrE
MVTGGDGTIFFTDTEGNRIRKIYPNGEVVTIAGSGLAGMADGNGVEATFNRPEGIAIAQNGTLYVADTGNHAIRRVSTGGYVSTLVGNGSSGDLEGSGDAARLNSPRGIAVYGSIVYVSDTGNNKIRKITGETSMATFSGSGTADWADSIISTSTMFNQPSGITVDKYGNIYLADEMNNRIRRLSLTGEAHTLAGNTSSGAVDGIGSAASFNMPKGITLDESGNIYVADSANHQIRKVTRAGEVTTVAGSGAGLYKDGPSTDCAFRNPMGITIGERGQIFVADTENNRIRNIIAR